MDLVFRVPELRQWLINNDLMTLTETRGLPAASIDFKHATAAVCAAVRDRSFESEFSPGASGRAVLWLAANLAGVTGLDPLRIFMEDLTEQHAKLCTETIMYSAGFMDGVADPRGGVESNTVGPKTTLFDDLLWS